MRYVKKLDKTRVIVGYFKISSNKNIKRYHQRQLLTKTSHTNTVC